MSVKGRLRALSATVVLLGASLGGSSGALAGSTIYICTLTDYTGYDLGGSEWAPKEAMKTPLASRP